MIGLAGGTAQPGIAETGDIGVYGAGPTGVFGHGPMGVRGQGDSGPGVSGLGSGGDSRGGQFDSTRAAQVWLVPHRTGEPTPPTANLTPQAVVVDRERGVKLPKDGRGGDLLTVMDQSELCTLWFCVKQGNQKGPARWCRSSSASHSMASPDGSSP